MSVWSDGRVRSDAEAAWAHDRGLLLGDGLFETVLVRDGAACRLDRHLERLARSAAALGFAVPGGLGATVTHAVGELAAAEGDPGRAALRVTLTRGSGRGLDVPDAGRPGLHLTLSVLPDVEPGRPAAAVSPS